MATKRRNTDRYCEGPARLYPETPGRRLFQGRLLDSGLLEVDDELRHGAVVRHEPDLQIVLEPFEVLERRPCVFECRLRILWPDIERHTRKRKRQVRQIDRRLEALHAEHQTRFGRSNVDVTAPAVPLGALGSEAVTAIEKAVAKWLGAVNFLHRVLFRRGAF